MTLGNHIVRRPTVRIEGRESIIGSEILKNFVVTFDQQNKRVHFERVSERPIEIPSVWHCGFDAHLREGKRIVWYVMKNSPAESVGLRIGDVITSANGSDVSECDPARWRELIEGSKPLAMDVTRDARIRTVHMRPVLLVP